MGFWKDVKELRRRIKKNLAEGAGDQALIKALEEPLHAPPSDPAGPPSDQEPEVEIPVRMSAADYRKMMGLPPAGKE